MRKSRRNPRRNDPGAALRLAGLILLAVALLAMPFVLLGCLFGAG